MAQVHGGKLVARALRRQGTTHVFTLCGGHIQAIYDGCIDQEIRVVDVRHEQTAGHAADGYARVVGRPGVCLVTAGPGITDVVTALANAQRAGVPLVCIGGAGPQALADMGSLQEMDTVTLLRSITKWSVRVGETRRIEEYVDAAFRVAQADLPGPVYVEIPLDVLMAYGDDSAPVRPPEPPPRPAGDPHAIQKAAELFAQAERPVFVVGSQLRWSPVKEVVRRAANQYAAPFFLSGMARGALPIEHPHRFSSVRKLALEKTDLALVFGTPFDFRVDYGRPSTWNPAAKIVQVDLDGRELGRNRAVDVALAADSGLVLEQLLAALPEKSDSGWLATLRAAESAKQERMAQEMSVAADPPNPLRVCRAIAERLGSNDIVIGDGGDFVATAANVIGLEWPQLWMDPGPLGTLGIGPGYAMAAALARPESRVVIVYGDGSFGLHAMEFEAMVRQKIRVVAVIGNDAAWTQIRRGQVQMYGEARAVATALEHTRYERVVEAVGGKGFWVETDADLGPALDAAFSSNVAACINVKLGKSDFRKGAMSV